MQFQCDCHAEKMVAVSRACKQTRSGSGGWEVVTALHRGLSNSVV